MSRKSTVLSILLTIIFSFSNIMATYSAYADELYSEGQTISTTEEQYNLLSEEILSLNSEVSKLNIEIDNINSQLQENENQIKTTEIEIKNTKLLLDQTEKEIKENEETLNKRLRTVQKSDLTSNIIVYLITSKNISDLFDRFNSINKILSMDKNLINEVREKKEAIDETIKGLNKKEASLQALKEQIKISLNELEVKKSNLENKMAEVNKEFSKVASVIEANEQRLIAHSVSVINSSNDVSEIQNAISTLNSLIPTLNIDSVIQTANDSINIGNSKINESSNPSRGNILSSGNFEGTALATYTMASTAYTGGTFTATGTRPVYNPGGISTVAVDPSVIPLGSKVYVSGYGVAIAADTGGAIKGHIVDVYLNSVYDCLQWGRRTVTVHLLALPGQW